MGRDVRPSQGPKGTEQQLERTTRTQEGRISVIRFEGLTYSTLGNTVRDMNKREKSGNRAADGQINIET